MTTAQQPASTAEAAVAFDAATASQRKATELGVGAAGADPAYIRTMEEFAAMPHAEIYRRAQEMQPGVMTQTAESWKAISTALTGNVIGINAKVNATIAQGWEGQTAQAVSAATRLLTGRLTELQNVTQVVAWRVDAAARGAETVKAQIQPPPVTVPGPTVLGAENPVGAVGSTQAQSDAWQAAIWTMRNNYQPTYEPAGQDVPVFPISNGLGGNEIPTGTGSPAPNGGGTDTDPVASGPVQPTGTDDSPATGDTAEQGATSTTGDTTGTDTSTTGDDTSGTDDQSTDDDTTAASTQQPSTSGTPSGNPKGTGSPGTGGPGGAGNPGPGGPGAAGPGNPGPGAPGTPIRGGSPIVAGAPGNPGRTGVPAAASTGTRSAAGMHGMPGMGAPAAARQNQKGDDEHQGRPELRIHPRNRVDLVGPPQGTVPPVLGAQSPERRRPTDREL
ncbi:WXG100 family type VII secretion target [Nocardia sp. SSK8]|uniref:WXG100 family type VII secretion target n=1 Tax=Nocardia sp. SSK8 TaxID=3120154 RepID=UPI00300B258F